jgi:hypothetical protein
MKPLQQTIVKQAIAPVAIVDNAAYSSNCIDTTGLNYGEFHINLGATDIAPAVLKVMEAEAITDATTLTSGTLVTEVTKFTDSDDNNILVVGIDFIKARKKHVQLQVTGGNGSAGTFLAATFVGQKDGVTGTDAADRGVLTADYA